MPNFTINEGDGNSIYKQLRKSAVKVGDTIEFVPNNQQGYEKYEVIRNEKGEKALKLVDSYDMQMAADSDEEVSPEIKIKKSRRSKKSKSSKKNSLMKSMGGRRHRSKTHKRR